MFFTGKLLSAWYLQKRKAIRRGGILQAVHCQR
jgi:hypothetical protein